MNTQQIISLAYRNGFAVPAFNVPYLPMVKPIIAAVRDEDSFALVQVARLEWEKFESQSLEAVKDAYKNFEDTRHVRLHLDHVPVVDEDNMTVDYMEIIGRAMALGYQSVMIDGSRLPLNENIAATKKACEAAHRAGLPCEAELGAVMGHESGPMPDYEEIFASGKGFTRADEAAAFVAQTGCDWLSVAIGNIHGAISKATRGQPKIEARLHIAHLKKLKDATGIPLVLHGGSGIKKECIRDAVKNGIAKVNVGTEIRQAYEKGLADGVVTAQEYVYQKTRTLISDFFGVSGTAGLFKE